MNKKQMLKKSIPDFDLYFNRLKCTAFTDEETWEFIQMLVDCETPHEVASVAMVFYHRHKIDEKKLVTEHFIKKLIPFCIHLPKVPTVGNIRVHINNLLISSKNLQRESKHSM